MKSLRHSKIIEFVKNGTIDTQEELLMKLRQEGFNVTQATVSRDIKELNLVKGIDSTGRYKYMLAKSSQDENYSSFDYLISASAVNITAAQNIIVIKTLSGMAQAVCASMDAMPFDNIAGTIAGDDTIFVAMYTSQDAESLCCEFKKILEKRE